MRRLALVGVALVMALIPARALASHVDVVRLQNRSRTTERKPPPKIAFAGYMNRNWHIYKMNPDGTVLRRLTGGKHSDESPTWSPDGTKIAYVNSRKDGQGHIWVMKGNGSGKTELTPGKGSQYDPTWSPDGMQIAYTHTVGSDGDIWVMNADGTNPHHITNSWQNDSSPTWSPDGTKIAFVGYRHGTYNIYTIAADGSGLSAVTNTGSGFEQFFPAWSPDGKLIAYSRENIHLQRSRPRSVAHPIFNIFSVHPNGSGVRRITNDHAVDTDPAWSPGGRSIVYVRQPMDNPTPKGKGLYLIRVGGHHPRLLVRCACASPSWRG